MKKIKFFVLLIFLWETYLNRWNKYWSLEFFGSEHLYSFLSGSLHFHTSFSLFRSVCSHCPSFSYAYLNQYSQQRKDLAWRFHAAEVWPTRKEGCERVCEDLLDGRTKWEKKSVIEVHTHLRNNHNFVGCEIMWNIYKLLKSGLSLFY